MNCERCKEEIINPIDHEYCEYKLFPLPKIGKWNAKRLPAEASIEFGGNPPHHTGKEPRPEQKPITHNIAPLESRPPFYEKKMHSPELPHEDGMIAYNRNLLENS